MIGIVDTKGSRGLHKLCGLKMAQTIFFCLATLKILMISKLMKGMFTFDKKEIGLLVAYCFIHLAPSVFLMLTSFNRHLRETTSYCLLRIFYHLLQSSKNYHLIRKDEIKSIITSLNWTVFIIILMTYRKESVHILKPFKINNPRELRQNCEICQVRFQMLLNVEHQCKRCFRVICEKCSSQKIKIYQPEGHMSVHKCCSICMKEQQAINIFIKQNKLFFGINSTFSNEWIKRLKKQNISSNAHQEKTSIVTQFNQKIYQTNNNIIRFKSESSRILAELCASQNYSLRQFTGRLIEEVSTALLNQKLTHVMIGVYAYLKDIPYTCELIYLVFYLLCFCNQYDCYFIITRYIQKIFPQFFKIGKSKKDNLLSHELKVIIDMYKILLKKNDKEELDRVAKFLQKQFFVTCIKSLLINVTNITISFYLIDQILKNGTYISLYKVIAAIIFYSRQTLYQQKEVTDSITQAFVLKSVTVEQIKNAMVIFQKSNVKFEMDHQFFDSVEHRKLHQKYKQLQSAYQRSQQKYKVIEFKHNNLLKDYDQIMFKSSQLKKQNIAMTQQIIKNAQKFIMIEDIDKYTKENQILKKRNNHFVQENSLLRKQMEDLKKKQMIGNTQKIIFQRIKKDYEKEIVDLKTKNQIYQIQKQANDINFNTSFIEQKLQAKNYAIAQLQGENNRLKIQLDFYRSTRSNAVPTKQQTLFNANISNIQSKNSIHYNNPNLTQNNSLNLSLLQITPKEDKDSFKRYIQMGKKVTDKLKSDLQLSETRRRQLQAEVIKQKQTINKLQKNMELNQEINIFINQIPEDINYTDSIEELQNIISKQTNIHKKGRLQVVLRNFIKCLYEVRYRSIDAKLKENKIKQLYQRIHKQSAEQRAKQNKGECNGSVQNIDEALSWIGKQEELAKVNEDSIKKEQCLIM